MREWKNFYQGKRHAYRQLFFADNQCLLPQATQVLQDLARIGYAERSSFVASDPYSTAFQEGKRFVYLHILRQLDLQAGASSFNFSQQSYQEYDYGSDNPITG